MDFRPHLERLSRPVDGASLAFFRVAFGLIVLWECWRYAANDWIRIQFIAPKVFFKYWGFGWVEPWSGDGMYRHFALLAITAVLVASGCFYRIASAALFLLFTYVFLLDQARYLNHFYVVSVIALLMAVAPCHRMLSLDARTGRVERSEWVPAWSLFLLRAQLGLVYVFAGIAKLDADWLRGEPMGEWLARRTWFPVIGRFFDEPWAGRAFGWGGFLLDLTVVPFLLWKKTRYWAFVAAAGFHLMNSQLFSIGIFPWLMIAATTLFLDPSWPRAVFAFVARTPGETPRAEPVRNWGLALLAAWFAVQIALPLRHLLYPGPVAWTEEGHRFSWRMKLRDKEGMVEIRVRDAKTGESWTEDVRRDLTKKQLRVMAGNPDMLLQYAHHLARRYEKRGREVEVYATANVSLNGRQAQLLIDPEVDLAKQKRGLARKTWIRPFDPSIGRMLAGEEREESDE